MTLVANWIPFESPAGGPNFYPFSNDAYYDINIDNNGDGKPDLIYRYQFQSSYQNTNTFLYNTGVVNNLTDATLNFRQTYTLTQITPRHGSVVLGKNVPVAPSDVGDVSMPHYAHVAFAGDQEVTPIRVAEADDFAGQAKDPFFLDLRVFDLLYGAHQNRMELRRIGHRRAAQLQRQHHRAQGAEIAARAEAATRPATR